MTAEREMTLHEWVGKLPEIHRANREFLALQARIAELEKVAEAAMEWAHAAGQMPNKLQRALRAAGYLGGGDE